jgi:hypothetical protein
VTLRHDASAGPPALAVEQQLPLSVTNWNSRPSRVGRRHLLCGLPLRIVVDRPPTVRVPLEHGASGKLDAATPQA